MSPCHILVFACASMKRILLFYPKSSNMLAQGIFFFLTAFFIQLIGDGLIVLLSLAHCLRSTDRAKSLKSQQGLWKIKWNQSPVSRCSQSTSQTKQQQEMLRNSYCREHHFPLMQLQLYWHTLLCTLWSSMPSPGISDSFRKQLDK